MNMQKFLDVVAKAADNGITTLGNKECSLTNDIIKLDIKLTEKRIERNLIDKFLDKLHKILAILKD